MVCKVGKRMSIVLSCIHQKLICKLDSQGCTCHRLDVDETCLDFLRSKANIGW